MCVSNTKVKIKMQKSKMRALVYMGPKDVRLAEKPIPAVSDTDFLIKVLYIILLFDISMFFFTSIIYSIIFYFYSSQPYHNLLNYTSKY